MCHSKRVALVSDLEQTRRIFFLDCEIATLIVGVNNELINENLERNPEG